MTEDEDIWGAYAKSVKKLGHHHDTHELPTQKPAPKEEKKNIENVTKVDVGPVPDAWRTAIEADSENTPTEHVAAIQEQTDPPNPSVRAWKKEPLDLRIERNLSLGDVVVEAKLDLHGQTEAEAHARFLSFVEEQRHRNRRLVLVITGKGRHGESVLRANLPRWCDVVPLDEWILAVRTAAPHHGGEGAYYVLLRKNGKP